MHAREEVWVLSPSSWTSCVVFSMCKYLVVGDSVVIFSLFVNFEVVQIWVATGVLTPPKKLGRNALGWNPSSCVDGSEKGNSLYTWQLLVSMLDFCGLISQIPQSAELFGVSFVKNHSSLVSTTWKKAMKQFIPLKLVVCYKVKRTNSRS